jgi:hypothetical protein
MFVESSIFFPPSQKGGQSSIEGDKPSNHLESVNSDRKREPGKGLVAGRKLDPRRFFFNQLRRREAGYERCPRCARFQRETGKTSIKWQRASLVPSRESSERTIDKDEKCTKKSPSREDIAAEPEVPKGSAIDETLRKTGTPEMLILEWTN